MPRASRGSIDPGGGAWRLGPGSRVTRASAAAMRGRAAVTTPRPRALRVKRRAVWPIGRNGRTQRSPWIADRSPPQETASNPSAAPQGDHHLSLYDDADRLAAKQHPARHGAYEPADSPALVFVHERMDVRVAEGALKEDALEIGGQIVGAAALATLKGLAP